MPFEKTGKKITFRTDFLEISFKGVGTAGSCPAEKDNAGCYFGKELRKPDIITENKEFCDCRFAWSFSENDAYGESIGRTLPAPPTEVKVTYPKDDFTVENAAKIPCKQVLGTYAVVFER